jgi:hypothetical protein
MIDKSLLALGTLLAFAQSPAPMEDNNQHNAYAKRQQQAQHKTVAHQTHKATPKAVAPKKETA